MLAKVRRGGSGDELVDSPARRGSPVAPLRRRASALRRARWTLHLPSFHGIRSINRRQLGSQEHKVDMRERS